MDALNSLPEIKALTAGWGGQGLLEADQIWIDLRLAGPLATTRVDRRFFKKGYQRHPAPQPAS